MREMRVERRDEGEEERGRRGEGLVGKKGFFFFFGRESSDVER